MLIKRLLHGFVNVAFWQEVQRLANGPIVETTETTTTEQQAPQTTPEAVEVAEQRPTTPAGAQPQAEITEQQPETTEVVEQQPAEAEQQPSIPVDKQGNPLYEQSTPAQAVQDIYNNQGLPSQIADQFVANKLAEAKKYAEKLAKKEPQIGTNIAQYKEAMAQWQQDQATAHANVAFCEEVQQLASQATIIAEEQPQTELTEEVTEETTTEQQATTAEETPATQTPVETTAEEAPVIEAPQVEQPAVEVQPTETEQPQAEEQPSEETATEQEAEAKPKKPAKVAEKAKATPKATAKTKTPKRKKEVNFFKYVLPKKDRGMRPAVAGVFMRDGYRVATDTNILIAERAEYSPALEGRVINEDGIALVDELEGFGE